MKDSSTNQDLRIESMSFLRHRQTHHLFECCGSDISWRSHSHRRDESAVGYSLVGCSPAEPTSASPTDAESNDVMAVLQRGFRALSYVRQRISFQALFYVRQWGRLLSFSFPFRLPDPCIAKAAIKPLESAVGFEHRYQAQTKEAPCRKQTILTISLWRV